MTLWIMPESDREGRAVCQFWLQGGKHNETPTDKNESFMALGNLGPPTPPPPPLKEGVRSNGPTTFAKVANSVKGQ